MSSLTQRFLKRNAILVTVSSSSTMRVLPRPSKMPHPVSRNSKARASASFRTALASSKSENWKRAGLLHHFSYMVFFEDAGWVNPALAFFLKACRQAGEDPADCIHIGDDVTADVQASRAMGLTPVWLDRTGATSETNFLR